MSILTVKYKGSSVLNREAKKINAITKDIVKLAEDMLETMYTYHGVGLAAPQVGVSKQMIVVDCGDEYQKEPYVLMNPIIIDSKGYQEGDEGCLSLPGLYLPVKRFDYVAVEAVDIYGKKVVIEGRKLLSRCLQHEIDHLHGRLFDELVEDKEKLQEELPKLKQRIEAILRGEISPYPVIEKEEKEELVNSSK
ncbi:MAG: peptide deformylase [Candidatus Sericytochromatia bacterium]|nr:MAG: peptide deformylase [Candidatus Sericytochromatia bacterium]